MYLGHLGGLFAPFVVKCLFFGSNMPSLVDFTFNFATVDLSASFYFVGILANNVSSRGQISLPRLILGFCFQFVGKIYSHSGLSFSLFFLLVYQISVDPTLWLYFISSNNISL